MLVWCFELIFSFLLRFIFDSQIVAMAYIPLIIVKILHNQGSFSLLKNVGKFQTEGLILYRAPQIHAKHLRLYPTTHTFPCILGIRV